RQLVDGRRLLLDPGEQPLLEIRLQGRLVVDLGGLGWMGGEAPQPRREAQGEERLVELTGASFGARGELIFDEHVAALRRGELGAEGAEGRRWPGGTALQRSEGAIPCQRSVRPRLLGARAALAGGEGLGEGGGITTASSLRRGHVGGSAPVGGAQGGGWRHRRVRRRQGEIVLLRRRWGAGIPGSIRHVGGGGGRSRRRAAGGSRARHAEQAAQRAEERPGA